jgi:predicted glutamine amidotransferase
MFGYYGRSESDVRELYAGLRRACANDPTLDSVAPSCAQHCHGWGYVIHADNGLFHYRTARSIYEDEIALPKMEGEIRAIFHGRYASNLELMGHIFSHPFMAADDKRTIFFAHNGGVDPKEKDFPERKVDSEWAMEQIVKAGDVASALPKLREHTRSALNLLILTIGREKGTPALLQYFHYFKPKEPAKVEYYKMFEGDMPSGRALVSSTMTLPEAKMGSLKNVCPAKFDELMNLG